MKILNLESNLRCICVIFVLNMALLMTWLDSTRSLQSNEPLGGDFAKSKALYDSKIPSLTPFGTN